jgi:hypothetical protein
MQPELFLTIALVLAGFAFLQSRSRGGRKFSLVCFTLGTAMGVYALTHSWECAVLAIAAWVIFPIAELVFVIRKLRVPRTRLLEDASPMEIGGDELTTLTRDMTSLGFRQADECRLMPAMHDQYYRLFVHETEPVHASIGCVVHNNFSFFFVSFSTEDQFGRLWLTWDYPLTYGLKVPPQMVVFRNLDAESTEDLYNSHLEFLQLNNVDKALAPRANSRESARDRLLKMLRAQLEHNITLGILTPEFVGAENYRYSWRGTLFVAGQVLKDLAGN